ncbi:hypothetical protein HOK00_08675 [bacterium]|nr:hypothetical protein [bacterium]
MNKKLGEILKDIKSTGLEIEKFKKLLNENPESTNGNHLGNADRSIARASNGINSMTKYNDIYKQQLDDKVSQLQQNGELYYNIYGLNYLEQPSDSDYENMVEFTNPNELKIQLESLNPEVKEEFLYKMLGTSDLYNSSFQKLPENKKNIILETVLETDFKTHFALKNILQQLGLENKEDVKELLKKDSTTSNNFARRK